MKKLCILMVALAACAVSSYAQETPEAAAKTYTLTLTSSPAGVAFLGGAGKYGLGTNVEVSSYASNEDCYMFLGWKYNNGKTYVSTSPSFLYTSNTSATLTAVFSNFTYSVSVSNSPPNGGTSSISSKTADCGSTVKLSAGADTKAKYVFLGWSFNEPETNADYTFSFDPRATATIVAPVTFFANFIIGFTATASVSPANVGYVSGAHAYTSNALATVMAYPTNDCYVFEKWTEGKITVSTNACYSFTNTNNVTLTAVFRQLSYDVSTYSFPTVGGTTSVTGNRTNEACDSTTTVTAHNNKGFQFLYWDLGDAGTYSNSTYKFVGGNGYYDFYAYFKDILAPTLKVTSPTSGTKVATSQVTITGTASDNYFVSAVYYAVNGTDYSLVYNTTNGYTNWAVAVSLNPSSTNVIRVYAEDSTGNKSPVTTISVVCTANSIAPLSLADTHAYVSSTKGSFTISFGTNAYLRQSTDTNDFSNAGIYFYVPTGSNTAILVTYKLAPNSDDDTSGNTNFLYFTDPTDATFTNSDGSKTGKISFYPETDIEPHYIDGATVVATSESNPGLVITNVFKGDGTFTFSTSSSVNGGGMYRYAAFPPDSGVIEQKYTSPDDYVGITNYAFFTLNEEESVTKAAATTGTYTDESFSTAFTNYDYGFSTETPGTNSNKFLAPASIAGGSAIVTQHGGGAPLDAAFNSVTFSQESTDTNEGNYVGSYTFERTGSNTAELNLHSDLPPNTNSDQKDKILLYYTSPTTANFTNANGGDGHFGTLTFTLQAPRYAPASIDGFTVSVTETTNGIGSGTAKATYTFGNGTFTGNNGSKNINGTYLYAAFSPTVGMLLPTETGKSPSYIELTFTSPTRGTLINSESSSGEVNNGTFQVTSQ